MACEPAELGSGVTRVATHAKIGGLALSTAYRYRFVLTTGSQTTPGTEGEFSTFGIESFSFRTLDSAGEPDTQAGSTPYELIVKITAPTTEVESTFSSEPPVIAGKTKPTGTIKDILNELPPGLIGNPTAVDRCTTREAEETLCSGDAQIGVLEVHDTGAVDPAKPRIAALFNTIPPQGSAARFTGFVNASTDGFIDSGVRTGDDYGITSGGFNISGRGNLFGLTVRLWGVPPTRATTQLGSVLASTPSNLCMPCSVTPGTPERSFLRNPTSCGGPLTVRAQVDAYQSPGEFDEALTTLPAITGCGALGISPDPGSEADHRNGRIADRASRRSAHPAE